MIENPITLDIENGIDFDPISYFNTKFPTKESLGSLNTVIDDLKFEIQKLDSEILQGIHKHAVLNTKMKAEIQKGKQMSGKIVDEVRIIKQKAKESENLVHEMCKDIKLLDTAKTNLNQSISIIDDYSGLMERLDDFSDFCGHRNYDAAIHCLKKVEILLGNLKEYGDEKEIKEMIALKEDIIEKLKMQIVDDFNIYLKDQEKFEIDVMLSACKMVEEIGRNFKNKIMSLPVDHILTPYREEYEQKENCNMGSIEKRYKWFVKTIRAFIKQYMDAFPHYWGLLNFLVKTFCSFTRVQIDQILNKYCLSNDFEVKALMNALKFTLQFENKISNDLIKEYSEYVKDPYSLNKSKETLKEVSPYQITTLYKVKGSISGCFEDYLAPYIKREESDLISSIADNLQKDMESVVENSIETENIKLMNSSLIMFPNIKHLIKRGSSISSGRTLYEIFIVVRKAIGMYLKEISNNFYEEESKLTKKSANFLGFGSSSKVEDEQEIKTLFEKITIFINTIEYVKETLPSVADAFVDKMRDLSYVSKLNFDHEEELAIGILNEMIEGIRKIMRGLVEEVINDKMPKIPWDKLDDGISEPNQYVKEIVKILKNFLEPFQDTINNVYLVKILNKICLVSNELFVQGIFKNKKISEMGVIQLLCDFSELKNGLQRLSNMEGDKVPSKIYLNHVNKSTEKTSSIIRLLSLDQKTIVDQLNNFKKIISPYEFEKIMLMKGMKKGEISVIIEQSNKVER